MNAPPGRLDLVRRLWPWLLLAYLVTCAAAVVQVAHTQVVAERAAAEDMARVAVDATARAIGSALARPGNDADRQGDAARLLESLLHHPALVCADVTGPGPPVPTPAGCETTPHDRRLTATLQSPAQPIGLSVGITQAALRPAIRPVLRTAGLALAAGLIAFAAASALIIRRMAGRPAESWADAMTAKHAAAIAARDERARFLAGFSHEIRTPMNAILGTAEALRDGETDPRQSAGLQTIASSASAMVHVIDDILDLARIEAGTAFTPDEAEFDLAGVVHDCCDLIGPVAAAKGLSLAIDYVGCEEHRFVGDENRLRRVLASLLGTAATAAGAGSGAMTLRVVTAPGGGGTIVTFEVSAIGADLGDDRIDTLFEPFPPSRDGAVASGAGLGLAVSRELVAHMGGTLEVGSAAGADPVFRATLPLRHGGAFAPAPVISALTDHTRQRALRVLAVDAAPVNLAVLAKLLSRWGIEAATTPYPEEALEMLTRAAADDRPFDAVVLDYDMPDVNGLELAELVRAEPAIAATPIILLSASDMAARLPRHDARPFDATLTRPLRPARLAQALCAVFGCDGAPGDRDGASADDNGIAAALDGIDVLVVDDDELNRAIIARQLEAAGATVRFAANGVLALEAVRARSPRIVLMDIAMPVMGGLEATRRIRGLEADAGRPPSVILAVSANVLPEHRDAAADAGMDGFIGKPARRADLVARVAAAIGKPAERGGSAAGGTADADPAPDPDTAGRSLVGEGELSDLRAMVGAERLEELVRKLVAQGDATFPGMVADMDKGDAPGAAARAHKLAGGAGTLGCRAVAQAMLDLERSLKAGNAPDGEALAAAQRLWQQTRAALMRAVAATPDR